jgi:hypothetical protein
MPGLAGFSQYSGIGLSGGSGSRSVDGGVHPVVSQRVHGHHRAPVTVQPHILIPNVIFTLRRVVDRLDPFRDERDGEASQAGAVVEMVVDFAEIRAPLAQTVEVA